MLKIRLKDNKHSAVWLVEPKVKIGQASDNDFVIEDASVAPNHIEIEVNHESLNLVNVSGDGQVTVNGKIVEKTSPLAANDILGIGNIELEVVDPKREQRPAAPQPSGEKEQPTTGWALKANHTALSNRVFPIKTETVVGRSNDCDITLAAAHLSRRHVKLSIQDGLLYVKDLGSANGTYLNGNRVVGEERVRRGDELRFDTLSFGVIGPSEDMDKTTVRPVAAIKPPPKSSPQRPAGAANKASAKSASPSRPQPKTSAAPSHATTSENEQGGSKGMLIVVGVVVAVVVVVGIAFQQGLIGG